MRSENIYKTIAGTSLGIALILGVVIVSSTTVNAQYGRNDRRTTRNWDGYPNWGGSYQLRQTALNAGYNEGSKEGRNDRARGRSRNYQDFSAFNKATKDYSSRLGDRELYRRYFQRAFASGYDTEMGINRNYDNFPNFPNNFPNQVPNTYPNNYPGYNPNRVRRGRSWDGYPNWGGTFQLRQTALNAGYNEGHKVGQNDRGRGRFTDYRNANSYRNATKDYSSRLGDRELYRRYFREAFENGYADGYDGY